LYEAWVVIVSVVEVAPGPFVQVAPPSGLTCHWTDVVPLAAAVNVTELPAATVWLVGLVVTDGAALTVKVAADELVAPPALVKTARYRLPFCEAAAVKVRVVEVAPDTLLQVEPLLVLTCHCTVGAGVPVAAAENVAEAAAHTV